MLCVNYDDREAGWYRRRVVSFWSLSERGVLGCGFVAVERVAVKLTPTLEFRL